MNSKGLQCRDPGSQGQPCCSLVLSLDSTLEMPGEILKFPMPRSIKSRSLSRRPRQQDCKGFPGDSLCRITALTSCMLVPLPDSKADQLGDKLSGWEPAEY